MALSILYKNRDSWGRARGIGPRTLFKTKKKVDPTLQTAIFGQDLNFPILTCRTTSQPKSAQHFHLFLKVQVECTPIPLGVRSLPHPPGVRFYAPQPQATCNLRSALRQTKTKEPNDVQIVNMAQLQSANKTQTAQYRAPRPRLHLPKNTSHKLTRCSGDVHVTVINLKTKINGRNGSQEDGNRLSIVCS